MINLDKNTIEATCQICGFWNSFTVKEARLDSVIICRGCKANVQLRDHMGTVKRAERSFRRSIRHFQNAVKSANRTLTIRL